MLYSEHFWYIYIAVLVNLCITICAFIFSHEATVFKQLGKGRYLSLYHVVCSYKLYHVFCFLSAIYIYIVGNSKLKEGLPKECLMACSCAIIKLREVSEQLEIGAITILDLQKIKKMQQQMKRLCESASTQQKKASMSGGRVTFEAMISAVEQRINEFKCFKEQQGFLLHLCQKIQHEIKGITMSCHCV